MKRGKHIFFLFFFLPLINLIISGKAYAFTSISTDTLSNYVSNKKVGLVLSGGGAKGLSHIGVLKALEENNIPIDYVCGTSMGAIVGALYSVGYSPDEMLALFKSKEFERWYNGLPEKMYASYFYRDDPSPKLFSFFFSKKKRKLKVDLPTSFVSPYPMDLAVMQIFAPPSDACGYDFDKLMLPFFCVSADISKKTPKIHSSGDLGSAVRASMTFPFYFKPIMIDSTLLFDGGFYNNFPWDIMEQRYNPDYIIGCKCVLGNNKLDEDDVYTQILSMLTVQTDYAIPEEKGIVIGREYPFGIMDFNKVDEIVKMGYDNAQAYVEKIKNKVSRRRTTAELNSMRAEFKKKCKDMMFDKGMDIEGNLNIMQQRFVRRTIRTDQKENFDFNKFKRGYYRIIASKYVKTFYPSYSRLNDSLYRLKIKATLAPPLSVSIGGNISSSSLNQGYLGVTYSRMTSDPWKVSLDMNIGKYYTGAGIKGRYDIGVRPLAYLFAEGVVHQFDYFSSNQGIFTPDRFPNNAMLREYYFKGGIATPLNINKNILAKFSFVLSDNRYIYFTDNRYFKEDSKDQTNFKVFSPSLSLFRNTQNYELYPTEGRKGLISVKWIYGKELFIPGTNYRNNIEFQGDDDKYVHHGYGGKKYGDVFAFGKHNAFQVKVSGESYIRMGRNFRLGYLYDLILSGEKRLANYLSSIMYMPAFEPIPHSRTLLLKGYRANNYLGVGISPVFLFTKTLFLHTNISYFQPYKLIYEKSMGEYEVSDPFPKGAVMGNVAFVWQSPIGPVSVSASYYEKGEFKKWYPQLNVGFLLFKKKALED